MGPHNAWNARGCGRTARRPKHEPTRESLLFARRQRALSAPQTRPFRGRVESARAEPAHRQHFEWSSVSYQIPRRGLFRTESWNPWDICHARYAPRRGVECAYKPGWHLLFQPLFTCHAPHAVLFAVIGKAELCGQNHRFAMLHKTHVLIKFDRALIEHRRSLFLLE